MTATIILNKIKLLTVMVLKRSLFASTISTIPPPTVPPPIIPMVSVVNPACKRTHGEVLQKKDCLERVVIYERLESHWKRQLHDNSFKSMARNLTILPQAINDTRGGG